MPVNTSNIGVYYPFAELFIGTPFEERGTVTLVKDDATVEFSEEYVTSTMADEMIVFDIDDADNYGHYISFVQSVTDSDTLELKSVYGGANDTGVSYRVSKSYSSGNWYVRMFPNMTQISGSTGDIIVPIPLDTTSGTYSNIPQVMPMQNTKFKYHFDGFVYGDSSSNNLSYNLNDVIADLQIMCDYDGLLGFRMGNLKYNGSGGGETGEGSTTGARITQFTVKNKHFEDIPSKAIASIQMDLEICDLL
jgi:hypothetical protein